MTVISSTKDTEALTLTFVSEFDAAVDRVWQLWADPRRLERWWGPPTWPATFERHEFVAGGQSRYHMTGPDGTKAHGWWAITAVQAPSRLEFDDGFADERGEPVDPADITRTVVILEPAGERTRMTSVSRFVSAEQMTRMVEMGMQEGMKQALGQIDDILAKD